MATADHREGTARGAALRWTRGAVITLLAVLAVLVHHETAAALTTHVPAMRAAETSSVASMHHSSAPAVPVHASGHTTPPGVAAPVASDDNGACSGTQMQHCSAAGVDTMKLAPPHQPSIGCAPVLSPGAAVGRDVPGTTGRSPPDLSVLSRFLL
ncbi:hypothetical protein GCM10022403_003390 [Streptomyces coacervatus]|uniref:Secreted protein n=1 Tax=Streptomyces coacervatus TaxID=647381 RepID=A0ABP7GQ22_9ACTN|nr:hypothetical protein [Streptomyces coacervatus]MDF2264815.1 hypothetical protein [Streptomyces coacervatus]